MKHPFVKSLLVTLAVLFSVFFLAPPIQAQAPGADGSQDNLQTDGAAENPADDGVTCSIEKIGWILCPIIEGAARIGDNAFSVLAGNFLEIEPALVANDENGTKGVWEIFRNIANIMFIIAFMVIIYSQITGAGLSNYGIKKMLPRVIFAAILVNISYYICQGMVDISNAGGYIIKDTLTDLAGQISDRAAMPIGGVSGAFAEGGTLSAIAVGALAVGGAVYLLLPVLMPVVGLVVITAFIIIVILLLRKAIVIMLVVLSPIAFVAYLLPNTEKFFSKWLHMFWQLLMVFPVVGLLFGAGQLTSAVVLAAGSNGGATSTYATEGEECVTLPLADQSSAGSDPATSGASTGPCGTGSTTMTLGLVAAGIAIAPLLAVWSVLQGALSAAGAIGGKMAGVVSKFGDSRKKSRQDDIGRRRQATTDRREMNAMRNPSSIRGFSARRRAKRGAVQSGVKSERQRAEQQYIADQMTEPNGDPSRLAKQAAGANMLGRGANTSAVNRSFAGAQLTIEKAEIDEAKAMEAQYRAEGIGGDATALGRKLEEAVVNGDKAGAKAAQDIMFQLGKSGGEQFLNSIKRMEGTGALSANKNGTSTALRTNIAQNHSSIKSSDADIYGWGNSSSNESVAQVQGNAATYSGLTNDQLSTQTARSLSNQTAKDQLNKDESYVYINPTTGASEQGLRTRKQSIIASDAGKNIKGDNKPFFM